MKWTSISWWLTFAVAIIHCFLPNGDPHPFFAAAMVMSFIQMDKNEQILSDLERKTY